VEAVEGRPPPALLGAVLYVVVDEDPVLKKLQALPGQQGRLFWGPVGQGAVVGEEAPEHLPPAAGVVLEEFLVKGVGVEEAL
jgi:hypothetical protein